MAKSTKLALGTAQFGLNYGIANSIGQTSEVEVGRILETAVEAGIDTLDTAIAYGESERVLGRHRADRFKLITKLPAMPTEVADIGKWVRDETDASCERLKVAQLDAVLLHCPEQLLQDSGRSLYAALRSVKQHNRTRKIGVSIYEPEMLNLLSEYQFDIVQAPMNVFDQRLLTSGWADRLSQRGVELHVRSAFLQGLLLMAPNRRSSKFNIWHNAWKAWDNWLECNHLTPLDACLSFLYALPPVNRVVIGVDSKAQLLEILGADIRPLPKLPIELTRIDSTLLNPANWQTNHQ